MISISFLAQAGVTTALPKGSTYGLLGHLLYPIGFIIVILGRNPLYTENTLTPVTLTLTRFSSLPDLIREWGIALSLNLFGVVIVYIHVCQNWYFFH